MRLSMLHVNCVLLNVLNRITCLSYICKRECSLCNAKACDQEQIIETFASNSDSAQVFNDLTCTDETPAMLDHAISLIGVDIDEALRVFNNCIRQNAEYIKIQIWINKSKKLDQWFDHECKVGRRKCTKAFEEVQAFVTS